MNKAYVKSKIFFKYLSIFCLSYISSACSHQQIPLQTVFSSDNCAIKEPVLKSIHKPELNSLLKAMPRNFGQPPMSVPKVDFEKQNLILFALGQKSTGGYSIELYKEDAMLKEQKLYLPVGVKKPASDSYQIQLITSPCQVYSLPHADYSEIVIEGDLTD